MRRTIHLLALLLQTLPASAATFEWSAYGGDGDGHRYAPLAEITPANVERLAPAWTSAPASSATASRARTMR